MPIGRAPCVIWLMCIAALGNCAADNCPMGTAPIGKEPVWSMGTMQGMYCTPACNP